MRAYYRTSRRTGVSVGPLGMLIIAPFYVAVMLAWAMFYAIAVLIAAILRLAAFAMQEQAKRKRIITQQAARPQELSPPKPLGLSKPRLSAHGGLIKTYPTPEPEQPRLGASGSAKRRTEADEIKRRLKLD